MRPGQTTQVGTSCRNDAVNVIGLVDIAYRHGRNARFLPDPVAQRCLEHTSIYRPGPRAGSARGNIHDIDPGFRKCACNLHGVITIKRTLDPVRG